VIRRALLALPVLLVGFINSGSAVAQIISFTTTTTRPPSTTAPPAGTTATSPSASTTRTTAKSTTTRGSTTTRPPTTLPPIKPQPTVTTAADTVDKGPSGTISAFFPWLSGTGVATALGILGTNWFRNRRR